MQKFISLFSGCGGMDFGLEQAGLAGALAVDIDELALGVHARNLSIPTLRLDLGADELPLEVFKRADVLVGGSPCQGFSTVGHRRLEDPRNRLLLATSRIASATRPKIVVAENVPGVRSGAHKRYWDSLHQSLRASGYKTQDLLLNSADHGVPQERKRVFMVAWRTNKDAEFTFAPESRQTLADALECVDGLPDHLPQHLRPGSTDFLIAERIAPGQKLTNSRAGATAVHTWDIPAVFGRVTARERQILGSMLRLRRQDRKRDYGDADPIHWRKLLGVCRKDEADRLLTKGYVRRIGQYYDLTGTFNGKYRRLSPDSQSCTVDTRFGQARAFLHPTSHRGFTVREAARIQGFPDGFVFGGTDKQRYRMIGNAVPPAMARSIGEFVKFLAD
jgi:DNA (cytosine-5)-methyltransferase 1